MAGQSPPDLDFQCKSALDRIERIVSWASILLLLCGTATAAAVWDWLRTDGHWYPSCVRATRFFLVMGIFAIARTNIAQRYPCTMMNACVIPIAMVSVSIMLENPEVEVHHHAISGNIRRNIQQTFEWLEHVVPAAEFDAILAAASNAINTTSTSDAPHFLMGCIAQEMTRGTHYSSDSRCYKHEGFIFNLIIGQAFLLSTALHSGLTCRCCMATWLLSQLSSVLLLFEYSAPSLNLHSYSIATFMLLSLFLCLSTSLRIEWRSKMGRLFCACFPSQWQATPSCRSQHLVSGMDQRAFIASEAGTPEPVSNLQEGRKILGFDAWAGNLDTEAQQATESQPLSGNFLKIQYSNGLQATCSSEREVLIKDGAKYREVKAGDLTLGAKAVIVHVSEQTIAAVTAQPAPHGIAPVCLAHKNALLFAVDPQIDIRIETLPDIEFDVHVDCWGPLEAHTHEVVPQAWSNSKFSSPILTDSASTGRVEFELGHRIARGTAKADAIRTQQGTDEQFYSCESQFHSHDYTP